MIPVVLRQRTFAFRAGLVFLICLITAPAGADSNAKGQGSGSTAFDAHAPQIEMLEPQDGGSYLSPLGIQIAFRPEGDAVVDLATLQVTVVSETFLGVHKADITKEISAYATPDGIKAAKAEIPPGRHTVTIRVADSKQRVAEKKLSIVVRDPPIQRKERD